MKNKKHLEEKFLLGQETGHKVEAVTVAQEMRYARDEGGNRGFCSLNASNVFKSLSVHMLRMMCEYFDLDIANIPRSRKAICVQLLRNLEQTCTCISSEKGH